MQYADHGFCMVVHALLLHVGVSWSTAQSFIQIFGLYEYTESAVVAYLQENIRMAGYSACFGTDASEAGEKSRYKGIIERGVEKRLQHRKFLSLYPYIMRKNI